MEDLPPLAGRTDLAVLDRYLDSDHGPEDGMDLSELDGFLTGIVVGPELIPADEWLPVVWNGEAPQFINEEEERAIFAAILDRYNEIISNLDAEPTTVAPIYWEDEDGSVNPAGWAAGFLQALMMREDAWGPLVEHPEGQNMLVPFMLFGRGEAFQKEFGDAFDEEAFLADAPDVLPACVVTIHDFWRSRRTNGEMPL